MGIPAEKSGLHMKVRMQFKTKTAFKWSDIFFLQYFLWAFAKVRFTNFKML